MRAWTPAIVLALAACGGDGKKDNAVDDGITATGPGVLSVSPLATSTLVAATPLGNLNPPGHALPTDHVYLMFVDAFSGNQQANDCSARPVYAAGSGVVNFILQTEAQGDMKIMIKMTQTFYYYYDHVLLLPGIGVGSRVNAGDQIATTTGRCPSIDLGVMDLDVTVPGLINPARYGMQGSHAASPYKYFSEPLRSLYYSRVRAYNGIPADKDGRIGWGIPGTLAGDWFHSSIAASGSDVAMGPAGWPKSLSFAYDWLDGSPRISIGGTIATAGVLTIGASDPDPATVSVASGVVAYQGTGVQGLIGSGWVLVQMLADDQIRIEFFSGATSRPAGFTAAAQDYVR